MRLAVQRVSRAAVRTDGEIAGEIGRGAVVLVGVAATDSPPTADLMADKLVDLRYFQDELGRTNLDLHTVHGSLLVISQFTLLADVRHGRRPGFTAAASPEVAEPLVGRFVARLGERGAPVATGRFGAHMDVELVNDGPFTLVLDSERDL